MMVHATGYTFIGTVYVAVLFGLDKSVAMALHAMTYLLMGLADYAAHTKGARVGRLIGLLGLVMAFQTVEVGCAVSGENRPPIVMSAPLSPRVGR